MAVALLLLPSHSHPLISRPRPSVTSSPNPLSAPIAIFPARHRRGTGSSSPRVFRTSMALSNAYLPTIPSTGRVYKRMDTCLAIPPPRGRKPQAVIMFLGGAFVGASPEVTYSYLMELLAEDGFFVVSVPYNVTFDHSKVSREVFERFYGCLDSLIACGFPSAGIGAADLSGLPVFSVGHSNGALLQMLVGCYFSDKLPKANVIVSFNNRPASEAVPYFEQLGPTVSQVMPILEASPLYSIARNASGDILKVLQDTAGAFIQGYDQEAMISLNKFVDQLPSVMNQVAGGVSEFRPTPSENRDLFRKLYNVSDTLLVKFSSDTIDESDLLEDVLQDRVQLIGGNLEKVTLSGNHLTPCIQDITWPVGSIYTPADAIAQGLKSLSLNETKALARTILDWLNRLVC